MENPYIETVDQEQGEVDRIITETPVENEEGLQITRYENIMLKCGILTDVYYLKHT